MRRVVSSLETCGVLLAMALVAMGCSRSSEAHRDTKEADTDEDEPRKKKSTASSKKLVFDEPPRSAAARLTFDAPAPPLEPTIDVPARNDFFLEAVHRIGPQLRTVESAPRIKQVSIRRERVDAELVAASGDMVRSIDLRGDAVLDQGTKKDLILKTAEDLAARAFAIEDVDWAKIPTLVKDAPSRIPDGEGVEFVAIRRGLPFTKDVLVRVFVKPGKSADYTAQGAFIRTN